MIGESKYQSNVCDDALQTGWTPGLKRKEKQEVIVQAPWDVKGSHHDFKQQAALLL